MIKREKPLILCIEDEEDLIVPVILDQGERELGIG